MTVAHLGIWGDFGFGPMEWLFALGPLVLMAAFWAAVILLIRKLVRSKPTSSAGGTPAMQVLEERYARGEITRDEFIERRSVLKEQAPPGHH